MLGREGLWLLGIWAVGPAVSNGHQTRMATRMLLLLSDASNLFLFLFQFQFQQEEKQKESNPTKAVSCLAW